MKLTTLLITCLSISAYSQDYIVTNKGDTLQGEVKTMSFDQLDRVQIVQNKKKTIFTGLQVKGIYFKGNWYRPLRVENTVRFMKSLKSGYLGFYAFKLENQVSYDGRLLVKRDGSMMEVPNLNFKKGMIAFLNDCPLVTDKIKDGTYGRKDLNQIIDEFNACIENQSQTLKKAEIVASESGQKAKPLEELKKTIEGLNDFSARRDALDLINDMITKVKGGQTFPNYQVEALKGYLGGNEATKAGLEKFLASMKNN